MNVAEARKLLLEIDAAYPKYLDKVTPTKMQGMANMWSLVLENFSLQEAERGLASYVATDTTGFAPSPGQIIARIRSFNHEASMSAEEAWRVVEMAVQHALRDAQETYDAFPDAIKMAIGSPGALRDMAMLDTQQLETVEHSQFIRAYNTIQQREEIKARTPMSAARLLEEKAQAELEEKKAARIEDKRPSNREIVQECKGMSEETKAKLLRFLEGGTTE